MTAVTVVPSASAFLTAASQISSGTRTLWVGVAGWLGTASR